MKTMTYTLAFIDGKVCYECLPDTKGAFLFHGGWYMPFCDEDDFFQDNKKGCVPA
jgi:hypothetical protein